jgi:hypothetical protein
MRMMPPKITVNHAMAILFTPPDRELERGFG